MNKRIKILIIACSVFAVLYLIFAALPLSKELEFTPQWTIHIENTPSSVTDEDFNEAISFKLGQNLGYFTEDGRILKNISFPYKAAVSSNHYATYLTNSQSIKLYEPKGTETGTIQQKGFPYIQDDNIYVFLPGGSSFSKCDDSGEVKWTYEAYAPVTAFSTTDKECAAGLADGSVIVLDENGKKSYEFIPGGSRYPVILGTALSPSGNFIATLSGRDRQRFCLAHNDKGHVKVLYHDYLSTETTQQVLIKFSRNEKFVFYDYEGGVAVVDTQNLHCSHIPLDGHILAIKEVEESDVFFILSKKGGTYTVSAIEPFDNWAGSFSFKADNAFIQVKGQYLFVGKDTDISKIKVIHN